MCLFFSAPLCVSSNKFSGESPFSPFKHLCSLPPAASHSARAHQLYANCRAAAAAVAAGAGAPSRSKRRTHQSERRRARAAASRNAPGGENRRQNRLLVTPPYFTSCFNSFLCSTSKSAGVLNLKRFICTCCEGEELRRFISLTTD